MRKLAPRRLGALMAASLLALVSANAAKADWTPPGAYGPYNFDFPAGAGEHVRQLAEWGGAKSVPANGAWTIYAWVNPSEIPAGRSLIAGLGDPAAGGRFLAFEAGRPAVWEASGEVAAASPIAAGGWHFIAASSDGTSVRLYVDGSLVGEGQLPTAETAAAVRLAPRKVAGTLNFAGKLAGFTAEPGALSAEQIGALYAQRPDFSLVVFENAAPTWPVQVHAWVGYLKPQDAWTLPHSNAKPSAPVAKPAYDGPSLQPWPDGGWRLAKWSLVEAPKTAAGGAEISTTGFDAKGWYPATVPGTVLTTLVDRGVYPNPEFGLNNMAIPESLARQDYWYRTEFEAPAELNGKRQLITFKGINYQAEVWLNGERLGHIEGAFVRGQYDVTGKLKPGPNAIAVRISPPLHPGIPHEQSVKAGAGMNGGMQALDGPTFIATEGWDWIPGVRDRNSGLWQDVVLSASGDLRIGDPQVVTTLPKPDNSEADVEIDVPVTNLADHTIEGAVIASFDNIGVVRPVRLPPGETVVRLKPAELSALKVEHPRLWWPNGYGEPALHNLHLAVSIPGQGESKTHSIPVAGALKVQGVESDHKDIRFGMREISYELSLFDTTGHLRRVDVAPAKGHVLGQVLTDGTHEGIRQSEDGWVASLTKAGETSPAVKALPPTPLSPFLVIKVNGVKIAARGGSWGMDDFMKRVSRERLEPFFRLHRDANINIIRNWVGQDTEDVFYDLADEYGLLVTNDFWDSTEEWQLEAEDVPLFLKNAKDVISRYRNHPSIAIWMGRNEGVPQPVLNEGLEKLVRDLDGTRYYSGSSNRVNLQDSGPYNYREPESYFTTLSKGFAVEVGTPSFPTLEAFKAMIATEDQWPLSDAWAYHDWHQDGNGDVHSFMAAMADKLGPAKDLADFERKAQLMNYETYRAVFEGMNAELWTKTSGRMLWMTQPAWPSSHWQILSHDYDTHAAYYGVKAGSERIHVQMTLPDHRLELVNNSLEPLKGVKVRARVLALDGKTLADKKFEIGANADDVGQGPSLGIEGLIAADGAVVVELEATGHDGKPLSRNVYWLARDAAASRGLDGMKPQAVKITAVASGSGAERRVSVTLTNTGKAPSLNNKLTLVDGAGARILPAYYGDNYVSLLPGEKRTVEIGYPASAAKGPAHVALRGWNTLPAEAEAR